MLADYFSSSVGQGSLASGVHSPGTFLTHLVDFIAKELPDWRDHPERPSVSAEIELTAQLGAYLNGAARRSLDVVQFTTEVPDGVRRGRTLDMAVQPLGTTISVAGRSYTQFQVLLPIECKRLPTPPDPNRSDREYVIAAAGRTTGGIQRFKLGLHGSAHVLGVMIGYVQNGDASDWMRRVNTWIEEVATGDPAWLNEELVALERAADAQLDAVHRLRSSHQRRDLDPIQLDHLWIIVAG